ncbi:DNA-binding transcriptional regulator, MerR family [Promicromonospora umidemergens]|uniref:MerR family transcriptional regulator n=1 Tax=Promicromonospora umidemergens TaxID=629679 RepID=A0ABP8XAH5_9MICO|nr:MerR family transcriptional regulator [Promicromonospora umidemergens]MCP2281747.1 DNA-binding transcriptional regulator, MerR family [Promicromonospora umidemergens]
MAWSTRQLADLAGTTIKAVRHYHALGLLDEPRRTANGYKQYETAHLIRLLQIKRLSDLGLPLSQIATMDRADQVPDEAVRLIDAELAATIERLQRVRAELAVILRHRAPIDVPRGFESIMEGLSDNDRAMLAIYGQVLDENAMGELRELLSRRDPIDDEFDALPADADEALIQDLAERMAGPLAAAQAAFPVVGDAAQFSTHSVERTASTVSQAMGDLYHPAQLEVLRRAHAIATPSSEAHSHLPHGDALSPGATDGGTR